MQGNSVGTNQHTTGDDNIIPTKAQGNSATYLSRRNLHPNGASYLRGKRYLAEKQRQGEYQNPNSLGFAGETAGRLAAELGVSDQTINRDAAFALAVDARDRPDRQ